MDCKSCPVKSRGSRPQLSWPSGDSLANRISDLPVWQGTASRKVSCRDLAVNVSSGPDILMRSVQMLARTYWHNGP